MPVTEQLMGYGSWSLDLKPDTPASVWDALDPDTGGFGHIVVLPVPADPVLFVDADLLALARYVGVYRRASGGRTIGGVGLAAWLGDEDGKGVVHEANVDGTDPTSTYTAKTFRAWVNDALKLTAGGLGPIIEGTYTNIAGTLTNVVQAPVTALQVLDLVMDYYGGEWRINPDGTLDVGTESDLFVTDPTVVAAYNGGGNDGADVIGLRHVVLDVTRDVEDYSTRVLVVGRDGTRGAANISPATSYTDLHGNTAAIVRVVNAPDADAANVATLATAQAGRFDDTRRAYGLLTRHYDVTGRVEPGDTIDVYDPRPGYRIMDATNQRQFRGASIFPKQLRVEGVTWPVLPGLGVLFRTPDGEYVDLTRHVVPEHSGVARLFVGAGPRRLATGGSSGGAISPEVTNRVADLSTIGVDEIDNNETTTSTSYTDLTTTGPQVAVKTGPAGILVVHFSTRIQNTSTGSRSFAAIEVREGDGGGSIVVAAVDAHSIERTDANAPSEQRVGITETFTGLTPNTTHTVTAKYRVNGNTGTFRRRHMTVIGR